MKELIYGAAVLLLLLRLSSCAQVSCSPSVIQSEEYLRMILAFVSDYFQTREVSKRFKVCFDESCTFEVIGFDPRLKTITSIPPPVKIPVQIPLLRVLQDCIGKRVYDELKQEIDEENNQDQELQTVQNITMEFDRFADILTRLIENQFHNRFDPESEAWSPEKLYNFYRFLQLSLPGKDFTTEILPSVNFPLNELLNHAASGAYPYQICEKLLVEYQDYLPPNIIFASFKTSKLGIARLLITLPIAQKMKNAKDLKNRTALHYAAYFGDLDLVMRMVDLGFSVNKFDSTGDKPLHKAAAKGHLEVVRYLYGKRTVISSNFHNSPILKAVKNGHFQVVQFILNETNFISNDESKASKKLNFDLLSTAISRNNAEMVDLLRHSPKLNFSQEQIRQLIETAERITNIDFRIERILK